LIGRFASDGAAYSYLPASVQSFPGPEQLGGVIAEGGFDGVRWLLLAGGIIAIHSGTRAHR
jgi:demethylmenaquinone methyltransferase/2-methoxy-6-polyprenyl-1,4-benzoquinol methylase